MRTIQIEIVLTPEKLPVPLAVSSGNITDDMIQSYIDEEEGELVQDNSRFQIDP